MEFSFMNCMRRFSQLVLIAVNIFVTLLGLATMAIGVWAKVNNNTYLAITNNPANVSGISTLLIIIGLFVMIVGGIGTAGAIFANHIFGRITLIVYSVILALLILCEIIGGFAAAVKSNKLEGLFREGANETFHRLNGTGDWEKYEEDLHCCGVNSWNDYRTSFKPPRAVPVSCCLPDTIAKNLCTDDPRNDPAQYSTLFYSSGCADVVINGVKHSLAAIGGGAVVLGLFQITGIVMACFVAVTKHRQQGIYTQV